MLIALSLASLHHTTPHTAHTAPSTPLTHVVYTMYSQRAANYYLLGSHQLAYFRNRARG